MTNGLMALIIYTVHSSLRIVVGVVGVEYVTALFFIEKL